MACANNGYRHSLLYVKYAILVLFKKYNQKKSSSVMHICIVAIAVIRYNIIPCQSSQIENADKSQCAIER